MLTRVHDRLQHDVLLLCVCVYVCTCVCKCACVCVCVCACVCVHVLGELHGLGMRLYIRDPSLEIS